MNAQVSVTSIVEDAKTSYKLSKYRKFMFQPNSAKAVLWELIGMLLVVYDIIVIPLQLLNPDENLFTTFASWFIRIFWALNIPFSFLTGYVSPEGEVELHLAKVARQHAQA